MEETLEEISKVGCDNYLDRLRDGRDIKILKSREAIYLKAKQRNPERWKTKIRDWSPIEKVHLNPTREEKLKKIA